MTPGCGPHSLLGRHGRSVSLARYVGRRSREAQARVSSTGDAVPALMFDGVSAATALTDASCRGSGTLFVVTKSMRMPRWRRAMVGVLLLVMGGALGFALGAVEWDSQSVRWRQYYGVAAWHP